MDIVVTLPSAEYENFKKELHEIRKGCYKVWSLRQMPRKLKIGNRVYIIKNNKVFASMKVADIKENDSFECSTTQREFTARCLLYLDDFQAEEIGIEERGFRGFRYRWW